MSPGLNHVEPTGRPLVLTLSATITLIKLSVGPMDNNAYLLLPTTGPGVLVDAANDAGRIGAVLPADGLTTIVTTHRHWDHVGALAALAGATGAQLVAGQPDVAAIEEKAGVSGVSGVWDGDRVPLGDEALEVVGLVGHTPGSVTLAYTGGAVTHLFTGDSLFPGGAGQDREPGRLHLVDGRPGGQGLRAVRRRHGRPPRPRRRHHPRR